MFNQEYRVLRTLAPCKSTLRRLMQFLTHLRCYKKLFKLFNKNYYHEKGGTAMKKPRSATKILLCLGLSLIAAVIISAALGRYPISLSEIGGILGSKLFHIERFWPPVAESLLLNNRLPRIILACMVGGSLAAAGASYQGVFQNPMAAPDLLGASSGAAFGAALAIVLDLGKTMLITLAFACSLATVALVIFVGNRAKGKRVVGLILSGIMIGSLVTSATSFLKLIADPTDQLPAITYWMMGSLNGTEPSDVLTALIPMLVGMVPLILLRWRINLLTLGDDEAKSMGIHVARLRTAVIVSSTLITAASVCVSGRHKHSMAVSRAVHRRSFIRIPLFLRAKYGRNGEENPVLSIIHLRIYCRLSQFIIYGSEKKVLRQQNHKKSFIYSLFLRQFSAKMAAFYSKMHRCAKSCHKRTGRVWAHKKGARGRLLTIGRFILRSTAACRCRCRPYPRREGLLP